MDAIELFLKRRSVRKFNADPVPEDLIQQLLRAAMAAPSAVNNRPWEFVVVNEPSALQSLKRQLPLGQYNAPLGVVVIGNPRNSVGERFWIQDCSAAMENLHPIATLVKRVRSELGIPEQAIPLGIALIGYPAERKKPRDQYDAKRIHWQHY
jgi:nitroreductase